MVGTGHGPFTAAGTWHLGTPWVLTASVVLGSRVCMGPHRGERDEACWSQMAHCATQREQLGPMQSSAPCSSRMHYIPITVLQLCIHYVSMTILQLTIQSPCLDEAFPDYFTSSDLRLCSSLWLSLLPVLEENNHVSAFICELPFPPNATRAPSPHMFDKVRAQSELKCPTVALTSNSSVSR